LLTKRLLLVDADGSPRAALADRLTGLGYRVERADTAAEALAAAARCDLLLAAGATPDMSQAKLCQAWRASGGGVLALAADAGEARVLSDAGIDTLTKPVRLAELARALVSVLRVDRPFALELGTARFHPVTRELADAKGNSVRLTEKEAAILAYLHEAAGRAVPRHELLARVWGYAVAVTTHTLETHIYRLRRKLAAVSGAPALASEARGYRLAVGS